MTRTTLSSLIKQWRATVSQFDGATDAEAAPLADRILGLEQQIVGIPARTAEELAAKVLVVSADGEAFDASNQARLMAEIRLLAARV